MSKTVKQQGGPRPKLRYKAEKKERVRLIGGPFHDEDVLLSPEGTTAPFTIGEWRGRYVNRRWEQE